jgi:hypothetical protein
MALEEHEKAHKTRHAQIVVAEGKVTLEDLHKALDQAVTHVVRALLRSDGIRSRSFVETPDWLN